MSARHLNIVPRARLIDHLNTGLRGKLTLVSARAGYSLKGSQHNPSATCINQSSCEKAVNRYVEALADDIASGEWIDLPSIGKIQVIQEEADDILTSFGKNGQRVKRRLTHRLRTKFRLYQRFKERCKH